jgi:hypothetical protein
MMKITTLALGVAVALSAVPAMAGRGGGAVASMVAASTVVASASVAGFAALVASVPASRLALGSARQLGAGLTTHLLTIRRRRCITRRRAIRPRVMRPKATHPRATRRVMRPKVTHPRATRRAMRLLRSVMCRRPQARHLRAIRSRHPIRRPTPIAEAAERVDVPIAAASSTGGLLWRAPCITPR